MGHIVYAQGNHVLQRHPRARTTADGKVIGGDPVVRGVALGGSGRYQLFHHRARITRAGADLQALGAQRGDGVDHAGNRCGKIDNLSDLQRHKRGVDRIDIGGRHRAAEFGLPAAVDRREFAQRLNVLPFAKPHRHAGLFKGYLNIEGLAEGLDEDLRRGERAEVYGGACPVKDQCANTVHGGSLLFPVHGVVDSRQQGGDIGVVDFANVADAEAVALRYFARIDNEALIFQLLVEGVKAILRRIR